MMLALFLLEKLISKNLSTISDSGAWMGKILLDGKNNTILNKHEKTQTCNYSKSVKVIYSYY